MKYDVSSIKVLDDAIAFVRRRPEMFVGVAEVQPELLATSLAHDALALGVRQVEIHHVNEWWAVVSEEDWLTYH
jgi:predicted TIM-barrel fold metal-dependent hydrolase